MPGRWCLPGLSTLGIQFPTSSLSSPKKTAEKSARERERESYESLWLYQILQVSFCARSPHVVQAAATMGTGADEVGEEGAALQSLGKAHKQPSILRNPPCHIPHQQVPEKPAHSANLMAA